ncbi:MAG: chromosome segregation protein SMC [candidate division Zixibacteria bacterium]|nr:chromosome segregation protein SMC [candidate division Zixibacteria bacterium]
MYLKRLELLGFKSFPDKTVVKLTPGVTAVVGPNGCGKSNILDALRWVLGEQKVSLLRGSKMEEIIFNGTRDLKPLGMAEVTLVIQNNKGILPTEYSEVQITRRLFRSGESEYLLNKVPCRLKDITEMLMDTGIGAHVYSMIQQDMVDAILSDRTDDRRFLFEEAAGISKYKSRKKAALRKLEATEQDLLRLKDIVAEVTTQVNSLRRQMSKAERYQKLSEEVRAWELYQGKTALNNLHRERRDLLSQKDSFTDTRVRHDAQISGLTATQEEQRKQLTDLDRQLTEIAGRIYEKSEQAHTLETEVSITKEKRDNARRLIEKNRQDIEAYRHRKESLLDQINEAVRQQEQLEVQLNELQHQVSTREQELSSADERVIEARRAREALNDKMLSLEGRLSAEKTDDSNLKEQNSELSARIENDQRQLNELAARKETLTQALETARKRFDEITTEIAVATGKKQGIESELTALDEQEDELGTKVFDLSAALEAAEARYQLLADMIAQYEGYSSGVVAALEHKERWPGLIGTVAECIIPKPGYERAIEAALGDITGFIISRNRHTAEEAIRYLQTENKGKAGFLIMDGAHQDSAPSRPGMAGDGFINWADDLVTVPDDMRHLGQLLLARVAVVTPDRAAGITDHLPSYCSVVTTDGNMYRNKTVLTGGSKEGISLFGRKEKIAEEKQNIDRLNAELDQVKEARRRVTARIGALQAERASHNSRLIELQDDLANGNNELTGREFEMQSLRQEYGRIEQDKKTLSEKLEALKNRQFSLNLNYDQLAKEKEQLLLSLRDSNAAIAEMERQSEQAAENSSRLRISLVEQRSNRDQLESRLRHLRELIAEIDTNSEMKAREIKTAEQEITRAEEKIVELERSIKKTFDARTEISEEQTSLREVHSELREGIDNREEQIKVLRQAREEAYNGLHEIEIRLTETESETRRILSKIQDEYDINLEEIEASIPDDSIPPEERPGHIHDLKEKMKSLGAVNLLALEEYKASFERQEFLTGQIDDLQKAKSTLQSTITKINTTAKNLFLSTFEEVRKNFQQVFEELFTGGQADIRLLSEDDPLESPIEIIARPRGKKLLSITQMSGGERALTAISLLFAIYLVKPSPFCILDEIDAPLDDANIHRFLKIIKNFSDQTQFIIITHNKITMEASDNLYGITMEQPGITKVVSVRFQEDVQEGVVDTSLDRSDYEPDIEIPEPVRDRMTTSVNLEKTATGDDN